MTASKGIRRSTKWKAIATQQSTATFNQRLSAAFGVVVLAEAVVLAALWMAP